MKKTKYATLVRMFDRYRPAQIGLLILCTLSVTVSLLFAYRVQGLVNFMIYQTDESELSTQMIVVAFLGCVSLILNVVQTRAWHLFRYRVKRHMQIHMMERLLQKPASFFDRNAAGKIVSAIFSDGAMIAESAGIAWLMLFLNAYQLLFIIAVIIYHNAAIGFMELAVCVVYFLLISVANKEARKGALALSKETASLQQIVVEDVNAIFEIKALNEKRFFLDNFRNRIDERHFPAAKKMVGIDTLSYSVNQFMNLIFPMLILVIGGVYAYRGKILIGTVILFYTYTQKTIEPLNNLADFYRGLKAAEGAADHIYEFLFEGESSDATRDACLQEQSDANEKVIQTPENTTRPTTLQIDLDEFQWENGGTIRYDLHEIFHSGDCVAVQGESGAGKSSLLKLLCGFYPVSSGAIEIDGRNVRQMPEEEVFQYIKLEFQRPIMLEGSLRYNLSLGRFFEDEELFQALRLTNMETFARRVGLDYGIAEAGKNLSGGQIQRLALTRALLQKPKILILDEATSGLDEENEALIAKNLQAYANERQCILIVASHSQTMRNICNKKIALA